MRVGYSSGNYPSKRNIIDIVPGAHYFRTPDLYALLRLANGKLHIPSKNAFDNQYEFNDCGLNHVDIIHLFNSVSYSSTPWITTFETIVPRFRTALKYHHDRNNDFSLLTQEPKILKALEALSSNSCKNLIAISQCNLHMQQDFLSRFPQYRSEIEKKLICIHPPQNLLVNESILEKQISEEQICFMFVGNSFFRKGGMELLESFQKARRDKKYNLKLLIVSSLSIDNYAAKESLEDVIKAKMIIHKNKDWIDYRENLKNEQVLELMKTAHIGLLPTYADTYGYSVLEFQSTGCPVISTNVRALPEINDNEKGWVIEVQKNCFGEAIYATKEDRGRISYAIKDGLANAIDEIMNNKQVVYNKAMASINYVKTHHSLKKFASNISQLYSDALVG